MVSLLHISPSEQPAPFTPDVSACYLATLLIYSNWTHEDPGPAHSLVGPCLLDLSSWILWHKTHICQLVAGPRAERPIGTRVTILGHTTKTNNNKTYVKGERRDQNFAKVQHNKAMAENPRFKSPCGPWKRAIYAHASLSSYIPGHDGSISGCPYYCFLKILPLVELPNIGFCFLSPKQTWRGHHPTLFPPVHCSVFFALVGNIFGPFRWPARFITLWTVSSVLLLILSHHSKTSPVPYNIPSPGCQALGKKHFYEWPW